jgi:hypothetical protein
LEECHCSNIPLLVKKVISQPVGVETEYLHKITVTGQFLQPALDCTYKYGAV